jgi:hypothetical protein
MPSQEDVARIALALPGAVADGSGFSVRVNGRQFVHVWRERVDPKKTKVPNDDVVVVGVRDEMDKQTLLGSGIPGIFTEPHYDGWPSILVRLPDVDPAFLEKLVTDSYEIAVAKGAPKPRNKRIA